MIQQLNIHKLRNLGQAELTLARCNLIIGANGSGKTSLLEAVFLLSRGKSFRHHEPRRYIRHHESDCTIWAKTFGDPSNTLAIQKSSIRKASQTRCCVLMVRQLPAKVCLAFSCRLY